MERSTRQRTAIRTVITAAGRPLARTASRTSCGASVPEIGIATVYRNLKLLLEEGAIQTVNLPGESARYETMHAAHHHHHHFHCVPCNRVFDVEGCPGAMEDMAPKGFVIERHELTLYGTCAECAERARKAAAPKRRPRATTA